MEITATELKINLGKYLEAANDEEILVTKNGKAIARLTGVRTFKYDFSELEEFEAKIREANVLGEAPAIAYGDGGAEPAASASIPTDAAVGGSWILSHNGEPVAQLQPILKQKKKRKLGFMGGPPASEETDAALFESEWTDEEYEEWLKREL